MRIELGQVRHHVDLPASACLDDLTEAVSSSSGAIVSAPPGTGKTTLVPPHVASLVHGRVIVAQPRRIAARAAARRLAAILGEPVGQRVGYSVRGDSQTSAETRIEFVTTGLLVRRLMNDPDQAQTGAIILDEVHERQLDTDFSAALLSDIRQVTDLPVIAMSATVAAEKWAEYFDVPIVSIDTKMYPLTTMFRPGPSPFGPRGVTREFLSHIADMVDEVNDEGVLVFLPGRREISIVNDFLGGRARVLHGSVPPREQDQILRHGAGVVLATSIAETSLTVPGVRHVIDSGIACRPMLDYRRGVGGLVTVSESQAQATQRGGRAARLGPGDVRIAMSQTSFSRLDSATPPEIYTADLSELILLASTWSDLSDLSFIDPLPAGGVEAGTRLLEQLGALVNGDITDLGRRLASLPVHPRHGRALLETSPIVGSSLAIDTVALLEEEPSGDLEAELRAMRKRPTSSFTASQKRLSRLIDKHDGISTTMGYVVACAYPDRIARKRGDGYVTTGGVGAHLRPGSPLEGSPWLAVADLRDTGRTDMLIGAAVPITAEIAQESGQLTTTTTYELTDRLRATAVTSLGAIELSTAPADIDDTTGRAFLLEQLSTGFPDSAWTREAIELRNRLNFLARTQGEPFHEITDAYLAREDVLEPELSTWLAGQKITIPMTQILHRCIPWEHAVDFADMAPETFPVPSGRAVRIHYDQDQPYIEVKLQECFGLTTSPTICGVPLQFHLLSPAGRPLAVTSDLESFWDGPYRGVRSDMRGRYPKHPWPDDPTTAIPTAKTKRHQ